MKTKIIIGLLLIVGLSACSTTTRRGRLVEQTVTGVSENPIPGTVHSQWAEPMYDTVVVPGQIDPKGVIYRQKHKTVYEIRPDRYQEVQYSDDSNRDAKSDRVLRSR